MRRDVWLGAAMTVLFIWLALIVAPQPPSPHSVRGYIYIIPGVQVPTGTPFIVNDTNNSNYVEGVTSHPSSQHSGLYSVTIDGVDGDYMYTISWNNTHWGRRSYVLFGNMKDLDVYLNRSRVEQNLTILEPLNDTVKGLWELFNVTANMTALGGEDNKNCNATIYISNSTVLSFATGETAQHAIPTLTLGAEHNESWEVNGTAIGNTNITVMVVCENQTYFTQDNSDTVTNITIFAYYPYFENFIFDDNLTTPPDQLLMSPAEIVKVWCNGTANDGDGYSDLNTIQGIIYANTSSLNAQDNRTVHYTDTDCTSATWNTDGFFSCEFDVYFFAQPVNWTCYVNVTNKVNLANHTNDTSIVQELLAINISQEIIDFGTLPRGYNSGTSDTTVTVVNLGNVAFDITIDTYNVSQGSGSAMNCTIGQLPVNNLRFNETPGVDYSSKAFVPAAGVLTIDFTQQPQQGATASSGSTKDSYWGIEVPSEGVDAGGLGGVCTGFIRYEAVSDS